MIAKWKFFAASLSLFAAADVSAICTATLVNGECVGCPRDRWAAAASYNSVGGCLSCSVSCRSYLAAKDEVVTQAEPLAGSLSRSVNLTHSQLASMAERNPWAAATLLAIQHTGPLAEVRAGTMAFDKLVTRENFSSLMGGAPNATPLPAGVRARVAYRLERGPGAIATMVVSSFTVDEDERMLYKAYPDVLVEFAESPAASSRSGTGLISRQEDSLGDSRSLTAVRWQVAQ